jgi:hypothetical protein
MKSANEVVLRELNGIFIRNYIVKYNGTGNFV